MELFPISFFEYLFLFLWCFIPFLIGWFFGRKRNIAAIIPEKECHKEERHSNPIGTTTKSVVRAIQTRKRGGVAVRNTTQTSLEQYPAKEAISARAGETSFPVKDDLTQLHGVGPAIEKKLNTIGIHTFLQISKLTPEDIREIEKKAPLLLKKMEKENWIHEAEKHLHTQKHY